MPVEMTYARSLRCHGAKHRADCWWDILDVSERKLITKVMEDIVADRDLAPKRPLQVTDAPGAPWKALWKWPGFTGPLRSPTQVGDAELQLFPKLRCVNEAKCCETILWKSHGRKTFEKTQEQEMREKQEQEKRKLLGPAAEFGGAPCWLIPQYAGSQEISRYKWWLQILSPSYYSDFSTFKMVSAAFLKAVLPTISFGLTKSHPIQFKCKFRLPFKLISPFFSNKKINSKFTAYAKKSNPCICYSKRKCFDAAPWYPPPMTVMLTATLPSQATIPTLDVCRTKKFEVANGSEHIVMNHIMNRQTNSSQQLRLFLPWRWTKKNHTRVFWFAFIFLREGNWEVYEVYRKQTTRETKNTRIAIDSIIIPCDKTSS